ncbi:DnaJ-domain-containing protein [Coniochaeta ligniaria NRRL 30616]|uniref:DnaJ-domain-containing protein n=1 Tax=Coniochaeta ligniaria NRRL 30616 TaxID=1408157 RepID=A0A1J7J6W8_9PEZI|nr:DnaJ-domain-containing protein [Coniochaeta ligniaria NRRL 30616]
MPFLHAPLRAALPVRAGLLSQHRPWLPSRNNFHTSPPLRDDSDSSKNHYETLNVPTDASHAEIKKSFYTLSKTHHPDHNPGNPTSHARFTRIAEAYTVLSHADRRARYDRDNPHLHSSHAHHSAPRRSGSYSSTGPAGGRPPSGLSKRRGTFTGPPPSFYRSGGWGAYGGKRRAAHEETTGMGGMGPGQDPLHSAAGAAPHFDHVGHERMHRRHEEVRRAKRRREGEGEWGTPVVDTGLWVRFVVVTGIVVVAGYVPYWFTQREGRKVRRKEGG